MRWGTTRSGDEGSGGVRPRRSRGGIVRPLILGAGLLGASACGDLTAGGVGDVEVLVSPDSIAVESLNPSPGPARQSLPDTSPVVGTLQVRIQVFVLRPPGRWIQVTDGIQEVLLDLGEPSGSTIARRSLPAGSYVAVRTVFHRVRADVRGGLEVDGEPVTGEVDVDLGLAEQLEVFRPLDLTVSEGEITELGVDLHATRWLRRLDRDLRRVAARDFEDELALRPRPRGFP